MCVGRPVYWRLLWCSDSRIPYPESTIRKMYVRVCMWEGGVRVRGCVCIRVCDGGREIGRDREWDYVYVLVCMYAYVCTRLPPATPSLLFSVCTHIT